MKPWRAAATVAVLALTTTACSQSSEETRRGFIERGDRYSGEQKYSEAVIEYRNAVVQNERDGQVRFKLAVAYEGKGDLANALREYIRAADLMPDDVEAQIRAANGLIAARRFEDARSRAAAALAKEPKNLRALLVMGNSLAGMRDLDGAIAQLEQAIDAAPTELLTYQNLGALQLNKGDRDAAESLFKRAVQVDPTSESARLALANFYWATERREDAERELKAILETNPKSLGANKALAVLYSALNRDDEGERYMKAYADLATGWRPKLALADHYLARRRATEAKAVLDTVAAMPEGESPARLRLAALAYGSGDKPGAYKIIDELLAREPSNEEARLARGRFLLADDDARGALSESATVVKGNQASAAAHYLNGLAAQRLNDTDQATKSLKAALELRPNAVPAMIQLADTYLTRGDAAAALQYATQAVRNRPQNGIAHVTLGRALVQIGNLQAAAREVQLLERGNEGVAEVQLFLADYYFARRDVPRGRRHYARALELRPQWVPAVAGLVKSDLAERAVAAATQRVDALVAQRPQDRAALLLAGDTYMLAGKLPEAEQVLNRAIELSPDDYQGHSKKASLLLAQRRFAESRQEFEVVARLEPRAAAAASTVIGMLAAAQGDASGAGEQYKRAVEMDPESPIAANNLAWHYAETGGNLDLALNLAQIAKSKLPNDPHINDTLGWVQYKRGLADLAVVSLEQASRLAPKDPGIRYRLGLAHLKNGSQKKAVEALEEALRLNPKFPQAEDARRVLGTING